VKEGTDEIQIMLQNRASVSVIVGLREDKDTKVNQSDSPAKFRNSRPIIK
jgi:hypothetical protein